MKTLFIGSLLGLCLLGACSLNTEENQTRATNTVQEDFVASGKPPTYPFGLELETFYQTDSRIYEIGDCSVSMYSFENGPTVCVTDTLFCGAFGSTYKYYLFKNQDVIYYHMRRAEVTDDSLYAISEHIFDFKYDPMTQYFRRDTFTSYDFSLLQKPFNSEPVTDKRSIVAMIFSDFSERWENAPLRRIEIGEE